MKFDALYNRWLNKTGRGFFLKESYLSPADPAELNTFIDAAFKHFNVNPELMDTSHINIDSLKKGMLKFADRAKSKRTGDYFRELAQKNSITDIFNSMLFFADSK
jgi:hypothetical protein